MISTQWATRHQTIKQQILGSNIDSDYKARLQQGKFYFPKPRGKLTPERPPNTNRTYAKGGENANRKILK